MIGKIIGAFAGSKAAQHTTKIGGATGAALGVVAPMILRRLSLPAMVVLAAGGYAAKKLFDKKEAETNTVTEIPPSAVQPQVTPSAT